MRIILNNKLYKLYNLTKEQSIYLLTNYYDNNFSLEIYISNNELQYDITDITDELLDDEENYELDLDDLYITNSGEILLKELNKIRLNETNKIEVCEDELIAKLLGYKSIYSDEMTENEELFRDMIQNILKIYYAGHRWDDYFDNDMKESLTLINDKLFKFIP